MDLQDEDNSASGASGEECSLQIYNTGKTIKRIVYQGEKKNNYQRPCDGNESIFDIRTHYKSTETI